MKRYIFATALTALTIGFSACDDGMIEENVVITTEGKTVKMQGVLTGLSNWSSNFYVALAGFDAQGIYAVSSKQVIPTDNEQNEVTLVLTGVSDDVTNIQLCVLDRLRRHVMTFTQMDIPAGVRDTIYMDVGTVDVSMINAIQQGYFDTTCANCHGASNRAAAGLYLTEGKSYEAMVGVASKKVEDINLVEPGDALNSLLHRVLHEDVVDGIAMTHRDLVSEKNEQSILPLIDSWINNGAKEK